MNEWVIQTKDVYKSFKTRDVLTGVDLDVPRGSVVGLLGKNGAGKTTLIKCLLGLLKIQRGEISLLGENPWTLSAVAKEKLGYVPQKLSLYPWMKVHQVIRYTAAFYPHWNRELTDRLVREWELDSDAKVGPLSVGERQKLTILLALGHEPELLVLDEPAASLDPAARREFLRTILAISGDRARTVLFSTHITSDLERVADRVAILKGGRITYHDELDRLKDSVKRLRIVAASPLPVSLDIPGTLRCEMQGQEALVSVREVNEELVTRIQKRWDATVQVRDLNLEEIFLELHHG